MSHRVPRVPGTLSLVHDAPRPSHPPPPEKAGVCKWEGRESLHGGGHREPHNEELTVVILCWSLSLLSIRGQTPSDKTKSNPTVAPGPAPPLDLCPSPCRSQVPCTPLSTSAFPSCRERGSLRQP